MLMVLVLFTPTIKSQTFIGYLICQTWTIGAKDTKIGHTPCPPAAHRPVRKPTSDVEEFTVKNTLFVKVDAKFYLY